jgi:hypothetical protein
LEAFEEGASTTDFQRLLDAGLVLPEPASLSDAELSEKLWEVIGALAALGVFLKSTDHLDDRQLYSVLWGNVLRAEIDDLQRDQSIWEVDLVCGGGERATHMYLKHYADEKERQEWAAEFPDDPIPAHEDPPFDRDRKLPRP